MRTYRRAPPEILLLSMEDAPDDDFVQAAVGHCRRIARPHRDAKLRSPSGSGARILNKHFGRLTLAILFSLTLTLDVSAETVAQTARRWGLIGPWSLDCS